MQSVRSGRVFDSLRFLSVSIIRWLLSAICTQKTKVSPCRKAVQVFDVNYTPPTLSDEVVLFSKVQFNIAKIFTFNNILSFFY